jgi:tetratricopeptide (TPR) repeat protein
LLEGKFQKYGDQARLIVQLIQTGIEGHAWANDYNREWTDIFTVQSEVAQAIAGELKAIITPEENQLIEKIPTTNMSAYDLYLKGIQAYYDFWETGAIEQVHQSIGYFMKAIELDPEYSLAYTGLGRAYWMLGQFGPNRSPIHWKESKRLLKKAISLDPTNGWAYSELGVVLSNWDWDSTASKSAFENALELSPNRKDVYDHYIYHTFRVGNCERLVSLLRERKNRFDPDIDIGNDLLLLTCKEEFEEITRIADLEWDRNTGFVETTYIAQAYTIIGDYEKALDMSEYMLESHSIIEYGLTLKGMTLGLMGNKDGARKSLDELKLLSESRNISTTLFAGISLALGDIEKTKDYLEQALKERDLLLHEIDHWASFYAHKNKPWLKEIIDRSWIPLVDSESVTVETN